MKPPLLATMVLTLISWALTVFIVIYIAPDKWQASLSLLLAGFFAISSTVTLVLYLFSCLGTDKYINRHQLFQENLRRGILTGCVIVIAAGLKLIEASSYLNLILLLLIAGGVEYYFCKYWN